MILDKLEITRNASWEARPGELKGKLPTAKQLAEVVRSVLPERNGKGG